MRTIFIKTIMIVGLALQCLSCTDDVQAEYSHHHAFFYYPFVNTTPELRSALNNAGMFCKITFPSPYIIFTDASGKSTQVNRTAVDAYRKPMCIAGFLVGTPNMTDVSTGTFIPMAYDLVCPNCYTLTFIQRAVDFCAPTSVKCGACKRIYNLDNYGIVSQGEPGKPLERYRIMRYDQAQGIFIVQN